MNEPTQHIASQHIRSQRKLRRRRRHEGVDKRFDRVMGREHIGQNRRQHEEND
jgi:hypothetical protein